MSRPAYPTICFMWTTPIISVVETSGTRLHIITVLGKRFITTTYPMSFTDTLLQEFIITGIIISSATMTMEIGEGINTFGRNGTEGTGEIAGGTDLLTTLRAGRTRATGTGVDPPTTRRLAAIGTDRLTIHPADRIREIGAGLPTTRHLAAIGTDPLTMRRTGRITTTGADRSTILQAEHIRATGTGRPTTHHLPERIAAIGTDPPTMRRTGRITATGADRSTIHRADLLPVM